MNQNSTIIAVSIASIILFTGCQRTVDVYTPEVDFKTNAVSKLAINYGNEIIINEYPSRIGCSMDSAIVTPSGKSYSLYVENALISELKRNNLYNKTNALNLINIHLEDIESSSMFGASYWQFTVRITSKGSEEFTVSSRYVVDTHIKMDKACQDMRDTFEPALNKLMKDVFKHPSFNSLFIR